MPRRVLSVRRTDGASGSALRDGIAALHAELEVTPDFPPEVEAAAAEAVRRPRRPEAGPPELDRTDLPFLTIDPDGARDLDQALCIERDGTGFVVWYAIADVAAFVSPGDPVDVEAHRRGETLYGADSKIPLHPPSISEDAASLLPGMDRPALLWRIHVDADGERHDVDVRRARVRSRRQLSYEAAQRMVDDGSAGEVLRLLRQVGELRLKREALRGGVSLPLPEQEIDVDGDHWRLEYRSQQPVEQWNAQISLLTGMSAASLMVYARTGLLRSLPPPDPRDVQRLHRTARGLGIDWPAEQLYPDFIRSLDPARPHHAAMVVACTRLLRGAAYVAFDGELPDRVEQSALASEYAHVTAPLRRLADRYTGEVCLALCAGREVPGWVLEQLPLLPGLMAESGRLANRYEREVVGLVEAAVLERRVGETFSGVVVDIDDRDPHRGVVVIQEPAIEATVRAEAELPLGVEVPVVLAEADVARRRVAFRLA